MDALKDTADRGSTVAEVMASPPPTAVRTGRSWAWLVVGCLLFGASGLVRVWQEHRFDVVKHREIKPVFALKDLPEVIGKWRVVAGGESSLDPQISRVAGSLDSIVRTYVDNTTGVVLSVVVLFGRAETMTAHTPEVCYPASGYESAGDALETTIPGTLLPARFRSLLFTKKGGATVDREEVHYAFLHDRQWAPDVLGNWRVLRYSPPVFKVHVQRRIGEGEGRKLNNPTEEFLASLLPLIEERVNGSK